MKYTNTVNRLLEGNAKVIDTGFTNMDTFPRAFYREFGLSPSDYKKHPAPIPFFVPYGAKFRKLRKESIDVSTIQPIFIPLPEALSDVLGPLRGMPNVL